MNISRGSGFYGSGARSPTQILSPLPRFVIILNPGHLRFERMKYFFQGGGTPFRFFRGDVPPIPPHKPPCWVKLFSGCSIFGVFLINHKILSFQNNNTLSFLSFYIFSPSTFSSPLSLINMSIGYFPVFHLSTLISRLSSSVSRLQWRIRGAWGWSSPWVSQGRARPDLRRDKRVQIIFIII